MGAAIDETASSPVEGTIQGDTLRLRLNGQLGDSAARELHLRLAACERARGRRAVVIDFAEAGRVPSSLVAAVTLGGRRLRRRGISVRLTGLTERHRSSFSLAAGGSQGWERRERRPFLESIGEAALSLLAAGRNLVDFAAMTARAVGAVLARRRPPPVGAFVQQAAIIGADALPIAGLLSLLLGLTIAFQSALQLEQFGAGMYLADIVCLSMVRELGPMMTAILISARSGSAITSELAAMNVHEEIDAMRTMGLDPFGHLVLPRLAALTLVLPALTLLSILLGVLGGVFISYTMLDVGARAFLERALEAVSLGDFGHGVGKSVLFAWIIGVAACSIGLDTSGGAQNIGRATTRTVVASLFTIIVADSIIATVLAVSG